MIRNSIFSIYLIVINIISFFTYIIDKKKAIRHKYRIPEDILLLLSIIGGVLGSILGMMLVHHKTKKLKFIIINTLCLLIWLYIIIFCDI